MTFSSDGEFLAAIGRTKMPGAQGIMGRVWQVKTGREVCAFQPKSPASWLGFSADGKRLRLAVSGGVAVVGGNPRMEHLGRQETGG